MSFSCIFCAFFSSHLTRKHFLCSLFLLWWYFPKRFITETYQASSYFIKKDVKPHNKKWTEHITALWWSVRVRTEQKKFIVPGFTFSLFFDYWQIDKTQIYELWIWVTSLFHMNIMQTSVCPISPQFKVGATQ